MTSNPDLYAAIIEKAARAKFYRAHPEYQAGENHWENVSESYRRMFRDSVTRTLAPVYADIQAEALRGAAKAVTAESNDLRDAATCRSVANDLRARADELDGGTP